MYILGIHGLNNKPSKAYLAECWERAIQEGLRGSGADNDLSPSFDLYHWAGHIYDRMLDDGDPAWAYQVLPSGEVPPSYTGTWSDTPRRWLLGFKGGAIDLAGRVFGRNMFSPSVVNKRFPDLGKYYTDSSLRGTLRNEFLAMFDAIPSDRRVVVMAHSMGSIIALDALCLRAKENDSCRPCHFITLGSPLGLPFVKFRHREEFGSNRTPEGVVGWDNFSDKRDRICIDTHLRDDYRANSSGVRVVDTLVENTYVDGEGNPDSHKSFGYLRTPEMGRRLRSI